MPRRLERGHVCVGLILVGIVQEIAVTIEHCLADQGAKTLELVGVPICLIAIEDRRVERISNVI